MSVDALQGRPDAALLDAALAVLAERMPPDWEVTYELGGRTEGDLRLAVRDPNRNSSGSLFVEAKTRLEPKDARNLLGNELLRRLRRHSYDDLMVVAPYLSPRTQAVLRDEEVSYVDLTGNVWLRMRSPGLFVSTVGSSVDPAGKRRERQGLRGEKAGLVIRALAAAAPPYTVTALARATGQDAGYVSRILTALERDGYVVRDHRGRPTEVDWQALLRDRAAAQPLLARPGVSRWASPNGPRQALQALADATASRAVVTGSFAAARIRAVAAPALLAVYTPDPQALAGELGLFEVDSAAFDVLLAAPGDSTQVRGATRADALWWTPLTQTVIDCLGGVGRMPEEGEALLEWMAEDQAAWRSAGLDALDLTDPWLIDRAE